MDYLYETHCHSSQCSRCAESLSQDMVRAYQAAGYAGMVLTDHFIFGNTAVERSLPWQQRMQLYYDSFLAAKKIGDALDFDVIFGFEHYYGGGMEALVYGVDLAFLLQYPDTPEQSVEVFARRVHEAGGVLIHAHPYRERSYINAAARPKMEIMDGIELYNAWNGAAENLPALELAKTGDYILTSGGDTHAQWDKMVGAAGIYLPDRVRNTQEFAQALKEKSHGFRVNFRYCQEITKENLLSMETHPL